MVKEEGATTDVVKSPVYSTGVGLVVYGSRNSGSREFPTGKPESNLFGSVFGRMKGWFREFF